nr:hypothetical protein [Polaromonas sp. UBA4122]
MLRHQRLRCAAASHREELLQTIAALPVDVSVLLIERDNRATVRSLILSLSWKLMTLAT